MTDEKLDRRIQKTRRVLRDALIALIRERGYAALTVHDITERADINRVTFYFHYQDKDDLLYHVMNDLYSELDQRAQVEQSLEAWNRADALYGFEHIAAYRDLYQALWNEKGLLSFIGRMLDTFAHSAMHAELERLPPDTQPPIPIEIAEHFCAGAFLGMSRWWLRHGSAYSAEQMAEMYIEIAKRGGMWALGVDQRHG